MSLKREGRKSWTRLRTIYTHLYLHSHPKKNPLILPSRSIFKHNQTSSHEMWFSNHPITYNTNDIQRKGKRQKNLLNLYTSCVNVSKLHKNSTEIGGNPTSILYSVFQWLADRAVHQFIPLCKANRTVLTKITQAYLKLSRGDAKITNWGSLSCR